ncbi:MAG: nuclear transport factor 2 family protein, partial [Acidobacteriota bacterium]|nr:nuclear transport factor 2 family protein [Acidobacteriota bacterium]
MKKILIFMVIAIAASSIAFGQTKMSKDNTVEARVIAIEKASWEAWKNKDSKWFQANLTEDALHVDSGGVTNKAQGIKSLADCEVKS